MNNELEREVLRLTKEIQDDETALQRNIRLDVPDKIIRYKEAIDRKMALIKLLKE